MRVLVVGASGQLGSRIVQRAVQRGFEVVGTFWSRPARSKGFDARQLDKNDVQACARLVASTRPEFVIDTAALHNVDYCETHQREAAQVNLFATSALARAANAVGARLLFVSTDFVFDGTGSPPYVESDVPRPQSVYGSTKLAAEKAVIAESSANIVVRPSVVYSWEARRARAPSSSGKGLNFGTWLIEELLAHHIVRVVDDQVSSPTLADDLADAVLALSSQPGGGVVHAAGSTPIDRFHFAERVAETLSLDATRIERVSTADLKQVAPRPPNSSLASERLTELTSHRMLELNEAFIRLRDTFRADDLDPH